MHKIQNLRKIVDLIVSYFETECVREKNKNHQQKLNVHMNNEIVCMSIEIKELNIYDFNHIFYINFRFRCCII